VLGAHRGTSRSQPMRSVVMANMLPFT
jgi:hypothetical protein